MGYHVITLSPVVVAALCLGVHNDSIESTYVVLCLISSIFTPSLNGNDIATDMLTLTESF